MGSNAAAVVAVTDTQKRRMRSKLERRLIVEETLKPGASVSQIARAHDVNTNLVFHWRKLYRDGQLEAGQSTAALLPVRVADSGVAAERTPARRRPKAKRSGVIDIDLGHARVRIEGAADPECVRAALEGLIR